MKLKELAPVIRSKNAGPYWFTVDIIFDNKSIYKSIKKLDIINKDLLSKLYNIENPESISDVIYFDEGYAIKFNIKREHSSGSVYDGDVLGMQQHAPMLDVEIPFHRII